MESDREPNTLGTAAPAGARVGDGPRAREADELRAREADERQERDVDAAPESGSAGDAADELSTAGDAPSTAGDAPSTAGDESSTAGDEPSITADEPNVAADERNATADEPSAAADEPSAAGDEPSAAGDEPSAATETASPNAPADELSPAVRRLVRQYDLDITGIHGTGPSGRIRVGDVIGLLGGQAEPSARAADSTRRANGDADSRARVSQREASDARVRASSADDAADARAASRGSATAVFECDLTRALLHRKELRREDRELALTSYYLVACAEALRAVPEVAGGIAAPRFGVRVATVDGDVRSKLVHTTDDPPLASATDRLLAFDRQLRASGDDALAAAHLLIHDYGASGALLATPTPLGPNHAASVGIGRVRRQIVVRNVEGEDTPRVAALGHVTLTFRPERVAFERANRFLAHVVGFLERWPD